MDHALLGFVCSLPRPSGGRGGFLGASLPLSWSLQNSTPMLMGALRNLPHKNKTKQPPQSKTKQNKTVTICMTARTQVPHDFAQHPKLCPHPKAGFRYSFSTFCKNILKALSAQILQPRPGILSTQTLLRSVVLGVRAAHPVGPGEEPGMAFRLFAPLLFLWVF